MPYGIVDNGVVIAQFVVPMTLRSNRPVFVSDTLSLRRQVGRRAAQRWELETRLEPLGAGAQDLMVNLVTSGHSEPVTIYVPQNGGVIKRRTSNSAFTATGAAGATALTVSGNGGLVPKGTFIRFANHSKVYMLTADLNGNGTMRIFPELRVAVNATSLTHRDNVVMNCLYDTDTVIGMSYEDGVLMDAGTVKLIERI